MSVSVLRKVGRWIKWNRLVMSLRSRGVLATVNLFFERAAERRFDALHGVETTAKVRHHELEIEGASEYTPVPIKGLSRALAELPIYCPEWDFVDLGAGKGRALFVASQFAFKKIIGVELSADLVHIAKRNITRYRDPQQKCFDLAIVRGDAKRYQLSNTRLVVLYLFDPFDNVADMEQVLENIQDWLKDRDHALYVIYWHPRLAETFKQFPALKLIHGSAEYRLYERSLASSAAVDSYSTSLG